MNEDIASLYSVSTRDFNNNKRKSSNLVSAGSLRPKKTIIPDTFVQEVNMEIPQS